MLRGGRRKGRLPFLDEKRENGVANQVGSIASVASDLYGVGQSPLWGFAIKHQRCAVIKDGKSAVIKQSQTAPPLNATKKL